MNIKNLEEISKKITRRFDGLNEARDKVFKIHREIIKGSSLSIRATHRCEYDKARQILNDVTGLFEGIGSALKEYPELYYTGFVQDAQKEFAEASITLALVLRQDLPDPESLGVEFAPYLNGMGEAVGELRRYLLDKLRSENSEESVEDILDCMDEIYYVLITMDYPDAITHGLRRTADITRSLIEKTRGDLTTNLTQKRLQMSLKHADERLSREGGRVG
jgi:translin